MAARGDQGPSENRLVPFKDAAASSELRKWFGHDPVKWEEFKKRYWDELRHNQPAVENLRAYMKKGNVTFVYAA